MRFAWLAVIAGLLAGCAMNDTSERLVTVEQRLESIEVDQSDQAIQLAAVRERLPQDNQAEVLAMQAEIAELRGEVNALRIELNDLQSRQQIQQTQAPPSMPQQAPVSSPVVRRDIDPEDEYVLARGLYVSQRFAEAAAGFRMFVELFSQHELAPNAQYWLGECCYDRNDYIGALGEFQKVIDFYPESKKAPDAQLKMGLCYRELGKMQQARLELERVGRMYPDYARQSLVLSLLRELP
ncbi:MAG: tol-pal system protein YbgF [Candidatus Cloacimonetes bacterium]|nr:tol-pal system protein YbgF [Candidatus Cloacimonadota bacterium]